MTNMDALKKALEEKRVELKACLTLTLISDDLDQLTQLRLRAARLRAEIAEVEKMIRAASDGLNAHPLTTGLAVVASAATIYDAPPQLPDSVLVWCAALGLAFFVAVVKGWPVGFALPSALPPPSRWRPEQDGRITDLSTGVCLPLEEAVIEELRTRRHLGPSALAGELGVSLRRLWPALVRLQERGRINLVRREDAVCAVVDASKKGRRGGLQP